MFLEPEIRRFVETMKNGGFPMKNGGFPMKNGDLTNLTMKN